MIVRSNAIGIPLLAVIQGGVAMIGYWIFGAPNILFAGFATRLRQHHPNGRNSAGMVSDSCLHGIDRQLGSSHPPGHLSGGAVISQLTT